MIGHEIEVLYWGADYCKTCLTKWPLVEQTCKELNVPVTYHDVNDPAARELAKLWGFNSIPAVAVAINGRFHISYRAVGGLINRPALERALGAHGQV